MSKIEKALKKARSVGDLRLVRPLSADGRRLVPVPVDDGVWDLEQRASASETITLMRESKLLSKEELVEKRVIHPEIGETATVNAMRDIRTKIVQQSRGKNCIIMVTAVSQGSGSSFVATNLAVAFAFDAGKTALLIDCNLHNPSLHKLFPSAVSSGLTDYLENTAMNISEIIYPVGVRRLRVIPSGGKREIPVEYFTSVKMKHFIDNIKRRFPERYIVIDAPPLTESADTRILADLCDQILIVVPYGRVTEFQVASAVKALDNQKLVGVVFNKEPRPPESWRKRRHGSQNKGLMSEAQAPTKSRTVKKKK